MKTDRLYFGAAGVLLPVSWLVYFFALHDPAIQWLVYVGWVILAAGLALISLAIAALRSRGRPETGRDFAHSTIMVDRGIYAIVRHPLYLGWSLVQIAVIFFSQHWAVAIMGVLGAACLYLISRQEDRRLVVKFGDPYREYIRSVPAMNVLAGSTRLLRRGRRDSGSGTD